MYRIKSWELIQLTSTRQDAWTADEDRLLAEIVLAHIRGDSTQLKAFEEAGLKLARTAAACGFRWNSYVRKKYDSEIRLAKKQRKERVKGHQKNEQLTAKVNQMEEKAKKLNLKEVIVFLKGLESSCFNSLEDRAVYEKLKAENEQLRKEIVKMNERYEAKKEQYEQMKEEYKSLLVIMERARKMATQIHQT